MKKFFLVFLFFLFITEFCFSQAASEIYLFDLKFKKGNFSISNGKNITNHKGYDNQPSFHPDEPIIYYSSFNEYGRSDIKSYNYKTEETKNITTTPEREYSPIVTPDKQFISCVIQRDNGAQDLGKYPISSGEPIVLINDLTVGYYTWINSEQLALFVLGEPNTLQLYDLKTKQHEVIDEKIGRSLHQIPGEDESISYVFKPNEKEWLIKKYDPNAKASTDLIPTLPGSEDLCWTPEGIILMSSEKKIFSWNPSSDDKEWKEITLEAPFTNNVTRLAVSRDGKKLAVVVNE